MDNAGPDGVIFWKKKHCLALEYIKTVDLDYCSSLGCSAGQILIQKFTKFDQQRETVPTR